MQEKLHAPLFITSHDPSFHKCNCFLNTQLCAQFHMIYSKNYAKTLKKTQKDTLCVTDRNLLKKRMFIKIAKTVPLFIEHVLLIGKNNFHQVYLSMGCLLH